MVVQVVEILAPAFEGARSVAAELATIRPRPVGLVVVLVKVQGGLEAEVAQVAEELSSAAVENFHNLVHGRLGEPILLELQMDRLVLHQPVAVVERRATVVALEVDPERAKTSAKRWHHAGAKQLALAVSRASVQLEVVAVVVMVVVVAAAAAAAVFACARCGRQVAHGQGRSLAHSHGTGQAELEVVTEVLLLLLLHVMSGERGGSSGGGGCSCCCCCLATGQPQRIVAQMRLLRTGCAGERGQGCGGLCVSVLLLMMLLLVS